MEQVFHRDVYLPVQFAVRVWEGKLDYATHARDEARIDRYGAVKLPAEIPSWFKLIESYVEEGRVVKQLWRGRVDTKRDLILVVLSNGVVKTAWVNLRSDKHVTLQREKYVPAP
jgi:hypothetical protein